MVSFAIACFVILYIALLFSWYNTQSLKENIPLSINLIVIISFFLAIVGKITWNIPIIIFVAIVLNIYVIIKKRKNVNSDSVIATTKNNRYLLIVVSVAILICIVFHAGRKLYWVDEFSFWGAAVKYIFETGELYTNASPVLEFREYTPALALFEYFCMSFGSKYQEEVMYMSYTFWCICLLLPTINTKAKKNCFAFAVDISFIWICCMFMGVIPAMFSVLGDMLMAFMVAYIALQVLKGDENPSLINICSSIFVLCLIKPSSVLFCVFLIGLSIIVSVGKRRRIASVVKVAGMLISTLLAKGIWSLYLNEAGVVKQYSTLGFTETLNVISNMLTNNLTTSQSNVVREFFDDLASCYVASPLLELSIFSFVLVFCALVCWMYKRSNDKMVMVCTFYYVITLFIFLYGTLLTCIVQYGAALSVQRYAASYLLVGFVVAFTVIIDKQYISKLIVLLGLIAMVDCTKFYNGTVLANYYKDNWNNWASNMYVSKNISNEGNILFLCQYRDASSSHDMYIKCRYMMITSNNEFCYDRMLVEDSKNEPKQSGINELLFAIEQNDIQYVYLYAIRDDFASEYDQLFMSDITNNSWWSVEMTDSNEYVLVNMDE